MKKIILIALVLSSLAVSLHAMEEIKIPLLKENQLPHLTQDEISEINDILLKIQQDKVAVQAIKNEQKFWWDDELTIAKWIEKSETLTTNDLGILIELIRKSKNAITTTKGITDISDLTTTDLIAHSMVVLLEHSIIERLIGKADQAIHEIYSETLPDESI